jgi:hypothetical protein
LPSRLSFDIWTFTPSIALLAELYQLIISADYKKIKEGIVIFFV